LVYRIIEMAATKATMHIAQAALQSAQWM